MTVNVLELLKQNAPYVYQRVIARKNLSTPPKEPIVQKEQTTTETKPDPIEIEDQLIEDDLPF